MIVNDDYYEFISVDLKDKEMGLYFFIRVFVFVFILYYIFCYNKYVLSIDYVKFYD